MKKPCHEAHAIPVVEMITGNLKHLISSLVETIMCLWSELHSIGKLGCHLPSVEKSCLKTTKIGVSNLEYTRQKRESFCGKGPVGSV